MPYKKGHKRQPVLKSTVSVPNLLHVTRNTAGEDDIVSNSATNIVIDNNVLNKKNKISNDHDNEISEHSNNSSNISQKSTDSKYVHDIPLESRIFTENNKKWIGNSVCFSFSKLPRFPNNNGKFNGNRNEAGTIVTSSSFSRIKESPARHMTACKV